MIKKITVQTLKEYKQRNEKFSALTAYDCCTAKYIDKAGVDLILVGDSLAMVALGYENTNSVTMDEMVIFTKAVVRGVSRAMVVADMPFLSCNTSLEAAVENCGMMIRNGANAVKIEGGADYTISIVERLTQAGIPVIGHLGFTPQFLHALGGYKVQGKTPEAAGEILNQAKKLEKAGASAVVLEMVPEECGKVVTENISIPTISCGGGRYCDGQILVSDDVFGKFSGFKPRFARRYGDMKALISGCAKQYNDDVKSGRFPEGDEIFN